MANNKAKTANSGPLDDFLFCSSCNLILFSPQKYLNSLQSDQFAFLGLG
jgi:hypothetical protein